MLGVPSEWPHMDAYIMLCLNIKVHPLCCCTYALHGRQKVNIHTDLENLTGIKCQQIIIILLIFVYVAQIRG